MVTLIVLENGYGGEGKTIPFDTEAAAREWADKYVRAFEFHKVFIVFGHAERIAKATEAPAVTPAPAA